MDFDRWYNPSQAYNVKHVSNPQLTATGGPFNMWIAMAAYTASQSDLSELIYTYRVQFSTACQILRYDTDQCEFNICKQSKTFQQLDNFLIFLPRLI